MLMRRFLICLISVLLAAPSLAGTDNPVVMTVNGYDVTKSEFEYFFRKNNTSQSVTRKSVKEYAELYLNFKLKVQAAMDEGMDKSQSFLSEYSMYRDMQAEEYLIDSTFLEEVARASYDESIREVGPDGLVYLNLISVQPSRCSRSAISILTMESQSTTSPSASSIRDSTMRHTTGHTRAHGMLHGNRQAS